MKKFNQYELSKNDKQLIKNFQINEDYKTLFQEEQDTYWEKILESNRTSSLNKLYSKLRWMQSYKTTINNEYFLYDYYEKNFYNIFFYNINYIKEKELTTRKEDIDLFSVICSIVIDEYKYKRTLSYKIKLPNKYTKLYFKLIDKVFRQNKILDFKLKKINGEYFYYKYRKCHRHLKWNTRREFSEAVFKCGKFVDRIKLIKTLKYQYRAK